MKFGLKCKDWSLSEKGQLVKIFLTRRDIASKKYSKDFQLNALIQIKMMIESILQNMIVVPLLFVFTNFCYLFAIEIHQHLETVYKFAILFGIIIITIIINS